MLNKNLEILAIIPARGGSKGLPGKNIKLLLGHPLIAYSILAAQTSELITKSIVSTDDNEIEEVAKRYGANIPFKRPSLIAEDLTTDLEVFLHALSWLKENENYVPDFVVQLRPTSPIRLKGLVDECIKKLINTTKADSLRVITESPLTPYKMWQVQNDDDIMSPLLQLEEIDEVYNMPRQLLPKVYWQIGTLDVIRTKVITDKKMMSGKVIMHHIVPQEIAIDIDDLASFEKVASLIDKYDCVKFRN